MELAETIDGYRTRAFPGLEAVCPICRAPTIPKCGMIVVHHWAHKANDCDPWFEPESEWHRYWKGLFNDSQIEVPFRGHRADILRSDGIVVELQHSHISGPDITAREIAYGAMVWLFDGRDIPGDNLDLRKKAEANHIYYSFRWKHPRKSYAVCSKPVFIDLGDNVFRIKKIHFDKPPYGGWGYLYSRDDFIDWLIL